MARAFDQGLIVSITLALLAGRADMALAETQVSQAERFYCQERRLGTWFYCKRPTGKPAKAVTPPVSYQERLAQRTAHLRELKARAILEPTQANVAAYIAYQREQLDQSGLFADVWQRLVWQTPELDYLLKRPVSTLGKQAWLDDRQRRREELLANLSGRYGVYYFYSSRCPACQVMSPVMRYVAEAYGLHIQAVSVDGAANPMFSNAVVDRGQGARMGLASKTTPALVLFDARTKKPIPIGYGVMSADEILERVFVLTQTRPGDDF